MIRETIVPAIPDIRDDNIKDVLRAIKATLDVREGSIGDPLDQLVTLRDLTDLNLAVSGGSTGTLAGGSLPVSAMLPPVVGGYNPATDFTTPPAPSGLRARGGSTNVYLEWDGAPYRNHGYTEIWRASVDALAQASFVGTTAASVYADPVASDTTYFYWIRFVSTAAITGPYNQTSGTRATTALDVSSALDAIATEIQSSQLFVDLGTRVRAIETDAYIQNLTSGGFKSQLDQLSAGVVSANSQITSLRSVSGTQATLITELSTTAGVKTRTFFQDAAPVSTLAYTLAAGDVWFDTDDNNKSYRWSGTAWVAFASAAKVYYQPSAPTNTAATPLLAGDLWYDSDDQNRPYRWSGTAWEELRDGFINARVTTLEQTKIGYATLNATGLVFDNDGAITDKATTDAWNLANPGNQATWRVGLPLATAVKQVGVTDGADTLTLEQRFTAQKQTNGELYGQYTVKIDNNGHVAGFGLASGSVNGTPTSAFIVRADRFAVAGVNDTTNPLGTVNPTKLPFIVTTASTTVNGKVYPAGTWIDTAFIANATITDAQITDLTADKLTAGAVTAALGLSTGKLWGGVAISTNKDNGTFGNLLYPFASANFGTGFFLGNDSGTYKFYVGRPDQNMNWNGSALTVTGTLNAVAGNFRNITVYDSQDRVILSSGGVNRSLLGLGTLAALDQVPWLSVAERPTTLAALDATAATDLDGKTVTYYQSEPPTGTVNDLWFDTNDGNKLYRHNGTSWLVVQDAGIAAAAGLATLAQNTANTKITTYYSSAAPTSPAVGDLWYNSDTRELKRWSGSAWVVSGNYVNNTNQIDDGAGLGTRATWLGVTGEGRPADYATRNQVGSGTFANRPAGENGDFYYATDTLTLYQKVAGAWVDAGTVGAPPGTLVNGVPVATITGAVTNFNASNDRKSSAIAAPTIAGDGTAVDHTLQTDGSADVSFEWAWGGTEGDIDGFQVYVYQSAASSAYTLGSAPAEEMVYEVPAAKRAFILFGVTPNRYYTFGVRAYRIVAKDVNAAGVITSAVVKPALAAENPYRPSAAVAFAGDVTGTVDNVPVATVKTVATNFNARNDRNAATVVAPVLADVIGTIDHTLNTDGSADLSLEWTWGGAEADIDGFIVYVHDNGVTTPTARHVIDGQANPDEMVFYVTPERRAFILSATAADHWYTFGIRAYRIVDPDIDATGTKRSTITQPLANAAETTFGAYRPASNVAFGGNVTGTVNSIPAGNINAWEYISGTGKPSDNATKNQVFIQTTAPTGASANDLWFRTDTKAVYYWSGSAWVLAGDVTATNTAAGINGQGALATASSVFIGSTVKFADGSTMNTGDFVNRLTKVGTGNITNFFDTAAIGDAYIGNLNAAKITAGTIAADRIGAGSITAAKIDSTGLEIKDAKGNVILRSGSTPINAVPTFSVVRRWDFDGSSVVSNSVDGFAFSQITVSAAGSSIFLTPTGSDPQLITPDNLNIDGSAYNKIQVRIKRTGGTGWDGLCIYKTNSHPLNATGYKYASDGTLLNTWVTLEWDMAALDGGGNDWTTSTIQQIRLDFGVSAADTFEIDWIAIGRYSSAPVHQITPENASTFIKALAVDTLQIAGNAITIPLTYESSTSYNATGTVLTYNFTMPEGGKVIALWQGQTDSARQFFFRLYLNVVPGAGSAAGYTYVGFPNGDYEYEFGTYSYVGAGYGDYLYSPAVAEVPNIGNTRTGGVFEDAPTAIGFGTAVAGSNTLRVYWQRNEGGTLTYQRLIILGAQR